MIVNNKIVLTTGKLTIKRYFFKDARTVIDEYRYLAIKSQTDMSEAEKIIVPNKNIDHGFKVHLSHAGNKRVLFSAPFGAGKSYFLEDFFKNDGDFLSIRLHPIDYSVASNEDIFELLKHDIINALIEKYNESLDLKKEDFSNLLMAQEFIRNKMDFTGIGKAIFTALVPHGESIAKVGEELKKLNDDFNDFKAEINPDQEKIIKAYLADLKAKKGSIRENDAITGMIKDFVKRIKTANDNKPFIFILDDLDRLDPEHLFRLFNVFTAHHDSKSDSNKFDFDQLIFVCDVRNIHHMFKHKYGKKVDFSGYIDKFYSSHIFYFDFRQYFKDFVKKLILTKYDFGQEFTDLIPAYIHKRHDFKDVSDAKDGFIILNHIINGLIDLDYIKIRSFERFQSYRMPNYKFDYGNNREVQAYDYYYLVYTSILQQFFPRLHEYEEAITALSKKYIGDYEEQENKYYYTDDSVESWIIRISLPFFMPQHLAFGRIQEQQNSSFEYPNESGDLVEIHYSVTYEGRIDYLYMKAIHELEIEVETAEPPKPVKDLYIKRPNPYWFFLEAFRLCIKKGFLRNSGKF